MCYVEIMTQNFTIHKMSSFSVGKTCQRLLDTYKEHRPTGGT